MLRAYRTGADLHTRTAAAILGKDEAAVTKADRSLAKALNFGLLYGMGAKGFRDYARTQFGIALAEQEAESFRAAFFKAYPGLKRWHRRIGADRSPTIQTRTLAGRRRLEVARFTERLNSPVQGTGADGLKLALALLWERRCEMPGAALVLAVHDEIVVEADEAQAGAAAEWLKTAMVDAMAPLIHPVPVVAEASVGRTWGDG